MCAAFLDFSRLHHDDFIGVTYSTKTVGDNNYSLSPTLDQPVQCLLHLVLALSIKGRRRLIKQKKLGLSNQSTCNSHSLLLATREFDTAFTHDSLVAIWEHAFVVDKIVGISLATSIINVFVCLLVRLSLNYVKSVTDIFANGA